MIKRVGLLFALLSFFITGQCQLLEIDSVEVEIVIPDRYRDGFVDEQDTLAGDDLPDMLEYFHRIDSLFPDDGSVSSSSGQITIETDKPYNRLARPVMEHIIALKFLANQMIEDDAPFDPYVISINWPDPPEYKSFAFSLKYRAPDYGRIDDFEPDMEFKKGPSYADFLQHPLGADTLINTSQTSPVRKSMERLLIEKPVVTEEVWDSIPDPPEFSSNEGRIAGRSVFDGIGEFYTWDAPDTKGKIEKKEEMKRAWKYGGTENIQFSQGFVENWAKGGENSISLLSDLRLHANYSKNRVEWESYGIHKLGVLNTDDKEMRVNDDLLELNSKVGLNASEKWFYSGLLNFKTQLFDGFEKSDAEKENPISGFMAPGYLTMALGMDYKEKNFTLMLMPFTSKMTAVLDTVKYDQTRYKVDEERKIDYMGGASLVNNLTWEISKDFNLASKMDVFFEYLKSAGENQVQGEWELILDMNISLFMSARISTSMRYYSNESDKLQLKENLSISFNYRF